MDAHLFIYGTLKEGFPNHALNRGLRLPGLYRTRQACPLYVVRLPQEDRAPWLVDLPGQGHRVVGQVFQVEAAALQVMDEFEEVGRSDGYVRVSLNLEPVSAGGTELRAFSYLKPPGQLPRCLSTEGPFPEYTQALAAGYWLTTGQAVPRPGSTPRVPTLLKELAALTQASFARYKEQGWC